MLEQKIVGPLTVEQVIKHAQELPGKVRFIGGGTDLIIQLREKKANADTLIDLSQVSELKYIKEEHGRVKIGAGTTFGDIAKNELIQKTAELLANAAEQVGSVQIRNRATIGGNIANAAPAGDSLAVLLALDANVTTISTGGKRKIPFCRFITGVGSTCLHDRELIVEVDFPVGEQNCLSIFKKVGSRTAVTTASLSMAAVVKFDIKWSSIKSAGLALGALGMPIRVPKAEKVLMESPLTMAVAEEVGNLCGAAVDETIAGRKSQSYKRWMAQGLGKELVLDLMQKINK